MSRLAAVLLTAVSLSGCVAVWGGAYNIVSETPDSVTIKYDKTFTNLAAVEQVADGSCRAVGRRAVKRDETTNLYRITTVHFSCVKA